MTQQTFEEFARDWGLMIDRAIPDGKIHRVPTYAHPKSDNGTYKLTPDGFGWVQAWDAMEAPEFWKDSTPLSPLMRMKREHRMEEMRRERQREAAEARQQAQRVLARSRFGPHRYLGAKGLFEFEALTDPELIQLDPQDAKSGETGCVVVPMRHWKTNDLMSVQWIGLSGRKKFMPRGRTAGAVHAIGPTDPVVTWVCEGFATALSIVLALRQMYRKADRVMATFSAHNLAKVAIELPGKVIVVADNDKPDSLGRQAGQEAAQRSGKPWVMPPDQGSDANDLIQSAGVPALAALMRTRL